VVIEFHIKKFVHMGQANQKVQLQKTNYAHFYSTSLPKLLIYLSR